MKRNPAYRIADVSIAFDDDGKPTYWINNVGWHAGQGSQEWAYAGTGSDDLECVLEILKRKLVKDEKDIIIDLKARIKKREEKIWP